MNKSIDILINKLKDIFRSLWKDSFFWLRKKPVKEITPESVEEKTPEFEEGSTFYYTENFEHGLNTTNFDIPVFKKPSIKPKEFKGFDNFPNRVHQTRTLTQEEFDAVLEEKRQALEDLLETNERGEILMGRDPESNEGFYMSKSEIEHIKKVMYYTKKRK